MNVDKKIESKFGKDTGLVVPDEFFDSIYKTISEKAASIEPKPALRIVTRWERFKPYIYLAAMFAGIWCMMKVVTLVNTDSTPYSDTEQDQIAMAMQNDEFYSDVTFSENFETYSADYALESEIGREYANFTDFEKEFYNI